jgi:hypothetical protein
MRKCNHPGCERQAWHNSKYCASHKIMADLFRPVFTFIADDGENIHIDTVELRTWCVGQLKLAQLEVFNIPLKYDLAATFIPENVISPDRVLELAERPIESLDPIIMVKDGTITNNAPNCMLVDGHHRFFLACLRKWTHIPGHLLEVPQWKPFQLHNLPSLTKDQLRRSPLLKRHY